MKKAPPPKPVTRMRLLRTVGNLPEKPAMSLTAEQRRALAMLARAGLDGASQALLMAHGFCVSMIVGLVNNGLATLTRETIRAGSRLVDVGKVRITAAGRKALTTEGLAFYPAGVAFSCARAKPVGTNPDLDVRLELNRLRNRGH
jgi:hypothetical protein